MAGSRTSKLLVLGAVLVLLGAAAGTSGLLGSAQGGKTITVGPSGCDFTTIQAAIDAAPNGSVIQVQTGSYKENLTIRNRDGLTLQGAGPDKVTLDGNGPQQKDITPGILILSSRNITVSGLRITNSRRGLEADDSTLLFIEGNTFERNLRASISLVRSQGELRANTIRETQVDVDGTNGQGLNLSDSRALLKDNTITGNADDGVRSQMSAGPTSEVTGSGNVVRDNKGGNLAGNAPATLLAAPPPEGTLDQVAVPADVPTIQEAVDKVKTGGMVIVAAGTYKEKVEIYKSLTLRGAGSDQTTLQAPGADWVALNVATDQLEVTVEGLRVTGGRFGIRAATGPSGVVTLRNVRVEGNGSGKSYDGGVWVFDQVAATLDRVTATANDGVGIVVFGKARLSVTTCTLTDNSSYGLYGGDVAIEGSTISGNGMYGVRVAGGSVATLRDCTVNENVIAGISVSGQATITNTRITGSKPDSAGEFGYGVYVRNEAQLTIQGSTISGNTSRGIRLRDTSQATLSDTRVTDTKANPAGNLGYGVELADGSSATLQKGTIENNSLSGLCASGSSQVTIEGSTISGNVAVGIDLHDGSQATIANARVAGTKAAADGSYGQGIKLTETAGATIEKCTITANVSSGVALYEDSRATIRQCTVSGNKLWGGIGLWDSSRAAVDDCTIAENGDAGVGCVASSVLTISNSRINNNKQGAKAPGFGIALAEKSRGTLQGNTLTGNVADGVQLGQSAQATITNNTITQSGWNGITLGLYTSDKNETAKAEISKNTIRDNKGCGVKTDTDSGIQITGQGNTISGNTKGQLCGTTSKFPKGFGGGK